MPTTTFVSSTDAGVTLKVSDFLKQPTLVQTVIANMLNKGFIADALLRQVPAPAGGAVKFYESTPMFADGLEVIAEYGEIPVATGADGTPQAVFTVKGGGALVISEEMRTRNDIDAVNRRLKQIRNGMTRFWDNRFFTALLSNPSLPTRAVTLAWTDPTAKIRFDVAKGKETVRLATDANGDELEFQADTLVVHPTRYEAMTYNDDVAKVFQGNIADKTPLYTGDSGKEFQNLRIMQSFRIPQNQALILERKTVGFIADERALRTTPMYEQRERESHRADTTRMSAVGIDAPKAAVLLTGV